MTLKAKHPNSMTKSLARFLVLAAIGSVPAISHARDLFDAPGPGYRQQMARISPQPDRSAAYRIRFALAFVPIQSPSTSEPPFSQPIRLVPQPLLSSPGLSLDALRLVPQPILSAPGLSLDAPIPATTKKPK